MKKYLLLSVLFLLTLASIAQTHPYSKNVACDILKTAPGYNDSIQRNNDSTIKAKNTKALGSGIDLTNVFVGITEFAIERSKMELNIAFFNRFQKFLDENPEAEQLFPNTLSQLNRIKSFQFNEFLPKLRKAFFDDLKGFPDNVSGVLTLPKYQKLLANFPEITVAIKSLAEVSKMKTKSYQLNTVIDNIASIDEFKKAALSNESKYLQNYAATWQLMNVISQALVNPGTNEYYKREELQTILDDTTKMAQLYTGIKQQVTTLQITFYGKYGDTLQLINLFPDSSKIIVFKSLLQSVVNAVNDFRQAQENLAKAGVLSNEDKKALAVRYIDASVKCIDVLGNVFNLFDNINATPYLNLVRSLTQITRDAIQEDYASVAGNSIGFLQSVFEMADATKTKNPDVERALCIVSRLLKYANFAANVVEAKSSKEVKDAIEAVALPPGSSSIKKNSSFNVSLQMHLGGTYNFYNQSKQSLPSWKSRFNITLPVGVSFNTGFAKGGSLGLFASIIDLGAIAQFKIASGDSSTVQEKIRFQNVLSPGVYASYGFPFNLPLSLNVGGQFGPGLTKVTADNGNTVEKPSWRVMASLTVDIPAFTLFNVSKAQTKHIMNIKSDFSFAKASKAKKVKQQKQ